MCSKHTKTSKNAKSTAIFLVIVLFRLRIPSLMCKMFNQLYIRYFPTDMKIKTAIGLGKKCRLFTYEVCLDNHYITGETVSAFKVENVMKNIGKWNTFSSISFRKTQKLSPFKIFTKRHGKFLPKKKISRVQELSVAEKM